MAKLWKFENSALLCFACTFQTFDGSNCVSSSTDISEIQNMGLEENAIFIKDKISIWLQSK